MATKKSALATCERCGRLLRGPARKRVLMLGAKERCSKCEKIPGDEPRGRGRPPLAEGEKRTENLKIALTPAELAAIDAVAEPDRATWVREVALRAARRASREDA